MSSVQLLDRKEALLTALKDMNHTAETHKSSAGGGGYDPLFVKKYQWLMENLQNTNKALHPSLIKMMALSQTEAGEASSITSAGGGGGSSSVMGTWGGHRVTPAVRALLESCERNARLLCQHHLAQQPLSKPKPAEGTTKTRSIQSLIESCSTMMLILKQCDESRRRGSLSPEELQQCIDVALTTLQPECEINQKLFAEIESSVAMLRKDILL